MSSPFMFTVRTLSQSVHTTSRGHYLIQQLHAGSLPDLLHYCPQFLIGLLQVPCMHTNSIYMWYFYSLSSVKTSAHVSVFVFM